MDSIVIPRNHLTASAPSRVPPELVDAVIDAGKDDKPFLKVCGLVCRAWVPASRRRLFERVALRKSNILKFCQLVHSKHVTILRHIRHLWIQSPSDTYIFGNTRLLSQLPFVKVLHLHDLDLTGCFELLEHGIKYFQSLSQLRISNCHFRSFKDLAHVLRSCPRLEDLSLVRSSWLQPSKPIPVAGPLPSLRQLDIQFASFPEDVTDWLLFSPPVPALHSLTLRDILNTRNPAYLNRTLQTLGSSLQHLDIDGAEEFDSSIAPDLSHNTELQSLTVGLDPPYSSTSTVISLLGPVSSSIRDVVFNTSLWESLNHGDSEDSLESIEGLDLREIDQFLCQPQFLHLRAVSFRLYDPTRYETIELIIKLNMPACLSRGILSIQNAWALELEQHTAQ